MPVRRLTAGLIVLAACTFGSTAPAFAGTCFFDPATRDVNVAIDSGDTLRVFVSGGAIEFADSTTGPAGAPCGDATQTTADAINVTGTVEGSETLVLDERGGTFAPGFTRETDYYSEIEIAMDLGGANDNLLFIGSPRNDRVAVGTLGIMTQTPTVGKNGVYDWDVDVTYVTSPHISIWGEQGHDTIVGRGFNGAGDPYEGDLYLATDDPLNSHLDDTRGTLKGGNGDDVLWGDTARDHLDGQAGDDVVYGNEGNDSLKGGPGNDTIYGGTGNDLLRGGSGNDDLRGEAGTDSYDGGSGNDLIDAADGLAENLLGGSGDDVATADAGLDTTSSVELVNGAKGPKKS